MKCQILFFCKNKKNTINLLSAKSAQSVVNVKTANLQKITSMKIISTAHYPKIAPSHGYWTNLGSKCK